jgi:sulfatase maturation enzyme AslB (radical SAM superfamily)
MCNQWGERGYYSSHDDAVSDAPIEKLITFLQSIESSNFLLSIHGGEPFYYKHMDELLDYVIETGRDTVFTTNATLLNRYLPKLGRLKNAMYIVSIDGDQDTNDRIRGKGTFQRIKDNLANLKECCLEESGLMPLLSMNFCVSEYIVPSDILKAYKAAKELGFLNINYGLRWFVVDQAGREYERQLREEFQVSASDCWKALRCDFSSFKANGVAQAIIKVKNNLLFRMRLPYVSITPRDAKSPRQIERHFSEHSYSYGREKCLFPFYFVRLHSNGDIIFCPGYRDIIAGNAFCDDFHKVINSDVAQRFRKFCLHNRFSICSKCCGLYLSYVVDKLTRDKLIS